MSAWREMLSAEHSVDVEPNPAEALFHAAEGDYDLMIVSLGLENYDALRLCSQVALARPHAQFRSWRWSAATTMRGLLRGLEIGVNDYLVRPIDQNELLARARTQIAQAPLHRSIARQRPALDRDGDHRRADRPVQPPLHGKPSRHACRSGRMPRGKPLTLMVLDIDYFKSINDSYGHDAGDDVLREFAIRIRKCIRGIDLACRYGGEEFVIVMPETDMAVADHGCRAHAPRHRVGAVCHREGHEAASTSRSRSASRRWRSAAKRWPMCSSAPTRRCIAPSATVATAWSLRRRDRRHASTTTRH